MELPNFPPEETMPSDQEAMNLMRYARMKHEESVAECAGLAAVTSACLKAREEAA